MFERGYAIVINSIGPEVREAIGCTGLDVRRVLRLGADFYVPALLEGMLGSKSWIAARSNAAKSQNKGQAKPASRLDAEDAGQRRKVSRPV